MLRRSRWSRPIRWRAPGATSEFRTTSGDHIFYRCWYAIPIMIGPTMMMLITKIVMGFSKSNDHISRASKGAMSLGLNSPLLRLAHKERCYGEADRTTQSNCQQWEPRVEI
jgi:hypothetical protein